MATDKDDKKQIGLTPTANDQIVEIAAKYFGGSQIDAYKFAIAYSIGADLDPAEAEQGGYNTKYHGEEIESGLRDVFEILKVGDRSRPRATAEKLADLGIRDLHRRLGGSESMADILVGLTEASHPTAVSSAD